MQTTDWALFAKSIFAILVILPVIKSNKCSKKCIFDKLKLNSTIPSDFCPSASESNKDINQECIVQLEIDFNDDTVGGSFENRPASSWPENVLEIKTAFSLNSTSIKTSIRYVCSSTDYCDAEFVRETLSPTLTKSNLELIRKTVVAYLYGSENNASIQCSDTILCPGNGQLCYGYYNRENATFEGQEDVVNGCSYVEDPLQLTWTQVYTPSTEFGLTNYGSFYCNIPNCATNQTIIDIFRWVAKEYVFPVNVSIMNIETPKTTTLIKPTMSSTRKTTRARPSNHASFFSKNLSTVVICSIISALLLSKQFFE